jgi:ribose/xylose/arabinose/galactoside ABC-type transport system permease subunit
MISLNERIRNILKKNIMELILVGMVVILGFTAPHFFTLTNLLNILRNSSIQGVIAFGMTMVIISGEIDLSVSSTVALAGVLTAYFTGLLAGAGIMPMESAVIVGMLIAFVASAAAGVFNGLMRVSFGIPTFIVTLAMMKALYGIAGLLTKSFPITTLPLWFNKLGAGYVWGVVPIPALILIAIFLVVLVIMNTTSFGRSIYAVGGNEESARLCGINVRKVKIVVMMVVQITAALGGILVSSQVMSGSHTFGKGYELNVIAAVIIGGASLSGGRGKAWGTLVGLVFMGIILNAMTLLNMNEYMKNLVTGALILLAVLLNSIKYSRD